MEEKKDKNIECNAINCPCNSKYKDYDLTTNKPYCLRFKESDLRRRVICEEREW